MGNQAKSVAFKAGKKLKRQRKLRKTPKSVALPHCGRGKRQRKTGNQAKSVAFTAGKKLKRQRKLRKTPKFVALPRCGREKRQRKTGNPVKSVAFKASMAARRQPKKKKAAKMVAFRAHLANPHYVLYHLLTQVVRFDKDRKEANGLTAACFFFLSGA